MAGEVSPHSFHSSSPNRPENRVAEDFPSLGESRKGFSSNENHIGCSTEASTVKNGGKVWKSLFLKEKEDLSVSKLPYYKPKISEGKKLIISPSDFEEEIRVCEKSLVGYFVGRRIGFPDVEIALKKVWNLKGNFRLTMNSESIFIFDFDLEEDRVTALEHGSMFLSGKWFMVRPWHLFVEESIEEMKSIPIWLNLRKIPLHLWNAKGIGMIASALGIPLLADKHTLARTRMSYARVCVEIEADFEYPESIPISFGGKDFTVYVEYSGKPARCVSCATFGHSSNQCPKVKRIWVPKRSKEVPNGVDVLPVTGVVLEAGSSKVSENLHQEVIAHITDGNSLVQGIETSEASQQEQVNPLLIDMIPRLEVVAKDLGQPADGAWTVYSSRKNKKKQNKQGEVPTSHLSPFTSLYSASEVANLHGLNGSREVVPVDGDNTSSLDTQEAGVNGDDNLGIRIEELDDSRNGGKQESSKARFEELDEGEDSMEESEYETDDEAMAVKVKPLKEVSRYKPMDKKQNLEKIFAFTSKIVKGNEGNGMVDKVVESFHQSKVRDLGPSSEDLGRGKRTPIPNKKV